MSRRAPQHLAWLALLVLSSIHCGVQYENERPARYRDCSDDSAGSCRCSAELNVDPGVNTCSAVSAAGVCCADDAWPDDGECHCFHVACAASGDSCSCSAGTPGGEPQCAGEFGSCCLRPGRHDCVCTPDTACGPGETQVPVCAALVFACSMVPGMANASDVGACSEGAVAP